MNTIHNIARTVAGLIGASLMAVAAYNVGVAETPAPEAVTMQTMNANTALSPEALLIADSLRSHVMLTPGAPWYNFDSRLAGIAALKARGLVTVTDSPAANTVQVNFTDKGMRRFMGDIERSPLFDAWTLGAAWGMANPDADYIAVYEANPWNPEGVYN